MNEKRWMPYVLNTLLTIALCGAYGLLQGPLSLVIGMLISVLLGMVLYKEHYLLGAFNSILVLGIFIFSFDITLALTNSVPIILLGLALALGTRFKMPVHLLILLCAGIYMADLLVGMELIEHSTGGEVSIQSIMLESGTMIREIFASQYQGPEAEMLEKMIRGAIDMAIMLAPGMFMIISTVFALVLVVMYKKIMQKIHVDMSFLLPFERFQGDRVIAMLYIVLLVIVFSAPAGTFLAISLNVLLILSFIFIVFGLSVFDNVLKKKGIKKFLRRLIVVSLLIFSNTFLMIPIFVYLIGGLTDSFFDYRHLRTKEEQ